MNQKKKKTRLTATQVNGLLGASVLMTVTATLSVVVTIVDYRYVYGRDDFRVEGSVGRAWMSAESLVNIRLWDDPADENVVFSEWPSFAEHLTQLRKATEEDTQ
jgi:hypothetical protein